MPFILNRLNSTWMKSLSILRTAMYEYYSLNNHQPSSHLEHDNPIPMCLMSALFVVTSHWRCLLLLRPELRRWEAGLVISPAPWELWEIGLWHWGRWSGHNAIVIFVMLSGLILVMIIYLSNFRGLMFLGWKHLILLVPRHYSQNENQQFWLGLLWALGFYFY